MLAVLLTGGPAAVGELTVSTNFDASTGRYGQPQSTTILFESMTAKYRGRDGAVWVTLPYLETIGPGNVIPNVGAVGGSAPPASVAVETGFGDVILGASRQVVSIPTTGTTIDAKGKIRFGTAPVSRGLGTGRNDYYLELDAAQPLGRNATLLASFGRRFSDSSPDFALRDVWYGSVGGSYSFSREWSAGLWLDMREPSIAGAGRQQEVTASLGYRPVPGWKLELYGVKGFASGSPAFGGGVIVTRAIAF